MKAVAFLVALFPIAAFAQAPPPGGAPQQEPVPITLDVRTQEEIKRFLHKAPYEFAKPIIDTIDGLQARAQMQALTDAARAKAQPKPEAK